MHLFQRSNRCGDAKAWLVVCACIVGLAGCAPLLGYPKDPEDTDATLASLQPYFSGARQKDYFDQRDATERARIRNDIILGRMHAYDITFADFEKRLYGDGNGVSLGSDLVGLVLGGLTATMGGAATKAALGAASTGVIGANTAINKDLYYQRTIPALLAQMEANRLEAKLPIVDGMTLSDAEYPLVQAYIDLDAYKNAGSIPAAINQINKDTGNARDDAIDAITSAREQLQGIVTVRGQLRTLTTDAQYLALAKAMQPYLATRPKALQQWVKTIDPQNLRLSGNAKKARQVINMWIDNDDEIFAHQQQWLSAIAATASK